MAKSKAKSGTSKENKSRRDIEKQLAQLNAERASLRKRFWGWVIAFIVVLAVSIALVVTGTVSMSGYAPSFIVTAINIFFMFMAFNSGSKLNGVKQQIDILTARKEDAI